MGWANDQLSLIVLSAAVQGFSGFFVYSPSPGPGNLVGSWTAAAGTDPYGNPYPAGLDVTDFNFQGSDFIINTSGAFFYSGTPATGNLFVSITTANGTDAFGNGYDSGVQVHGESGGGPASTTFSTAGSFPWVAPAGVTSVNVECWGGGGGSGGSSGGGGGGGEFAQEATNTVVPGDTYTVVVGAAGTAGGLSTFGGAGGSSSFTGTSATTVTAHGGGGSQDGSVGAGIGGTAGTGSTNSVHHNGGTGGNSTDNISQGGAGGASSGGTASAGNNGSANVGSTGGAAGAAVAGGGPGGTGGAGTGTSGTAGNSPASGPGGGAGGGGFGSASGSVGAAGFAGQVTLSWTAPAGESGASIRLTTQGGTPFATFPTGVSEEVSAAFITAQIANPGASEQIFMAMESARVSGTSSFVDMQLFGAAKDGSLLANGQLQYIDGAGVAHDLLLWGASGVQVESLFSGDTNTYQPERLSLVLASDLVINSTPFGQVVFQASLGVGTYIIDGMLKLFPTAAAGVPTFAFTGSAVATMNIEFWEVKEGTPATFGNAAAVNAFSSSFTAATMAGGGRSVFFRGLMIVTTAGIVDFDAATSVAADTYTIVHTGSYLDLLPVGS